ncbi:hypothetical protein CMI37_06650, partial [Candidatus Pacearchaeota archaeon]|nr:hypothetical protein [Candidatus Pacearchaeota archaeon]
QGWGRHTTVVTGDQGSAQVSKNEWNADLNETGMLGFDIETKTLSSDALTPVSSANIVAGEGGSADDFSFIVYGSGPEVAEEDILFFYKGSQVITVTHNTGGAPSNSGNIQLLGGASKVLDTNLPLILQRKGNVFYEIISSAGTTVTAASTTTFTNKTIDADGTGNSITNIENANIKASAGIDASKIADASVSDAEFQRLDGVSSDIQGQIDAKQATLTFGISNTNVTKCGTGIVDDDFIRIDGTTMEGRSASEVLSDIGASATAGNGSLVTVGALDSGSITSGFGSINNGSSTITTTGALASGAITTSGTLTMGDNIITGIKSLDMDVDTLAYGASVAIDFDTNEEIILGDLTGNIEFTGSNYALGKHKVLHMESDGSARTFTFPSGWVFYGTKPTTTVASKKSILSLSCIGSAEADVRAVFVEEA